MEHRDHSECVSQRRAGTATGTPDSGVLGWRATDGQRNKFPAGRSLPRHPQPAGGDRRRNGQTHDPQSDQPLLRAAKRDRRRLAPDTNNPRKKKSDGGGRAPQRDGVIDSLSTGVIVVDTNLLVEDLNPDLLLGFYYFLDYEDMLKEKFKNHHDFEDYDEVIQKSEILITASPQAVLENLASGGKPVYIQREDYTRDFLDLFESLNIPIVKNYEKAQLIDVISSINNNKYVKMEQNSKKLVEFIKENLNL